MSISSGNATSFFYFVTNSSEQPPKMSTILDFHQERQVLEKAFAEYDELAANGANASDLVTAQHEISLKSKALTMQLTPPGVFVLDNVFQVGPPAASDPASYGKQGDDPCVHCHRRPAQYI
jgi:hypothetical protein